MVLLATCLLAFAGCSSDDTPNEAALLGLPPPNENNIWFRANDSSTAVVFVHGIFSDSRTSWLHRSSGDAAQDRYWPAMLADDPRFENPSVFLGGYYTEFGSGPYDLRDSSNELIGALLRTDPESEQAPLDKERLVFIAHSTGGIVVRHVLVNHARVFEDKIVGLVLIASPSYGSKTANTFDYIADFYSQRLGQQLQWGSGTLVELDRSFKTLLAEKRIPYLRGVELIENYHVLQRRFLPNRRVVVEEISGARYFGDFFRLAGTDHFSAAKPDSPRHPAYQRVIDFFESLESPGEFQREGELRRRSPHLGPNLDPEMSRLSEVNKLAVLSFENVTARHTLTYLGEGFQETITTVLGGDPTFSVVERAQIEKVLGELEFQASEFVDPRSAQEIGRVLGVDLLILGSFQDNEEVLAVNARVLNVATGRIVDTVQIEGLVTRALDLQQETAEKLAEALREGVTNAERMEVESPKELQPNR